MKAARAGVRRRGRTADFVHLEQYMIHIVIVDVDDACAFK